ILYAALESRLYKTEDCARTWKSAYYSDSSTRLVTAVAVNPDAPEKVYTGLSDGSLMLSSDHGMTWKVVKKFSTRVQRIIFDPQNSNILYVGITTDGLWKSLDGGITWDNLNKAMKDFSGAQTYLDFTISAKNSNFLLYSNQYGLLRSLDGGITWSQVKLLTRAGGEVIYSIAIDPSNDKNLYYATNSAVYKSLDGGENWAVKKMPTTRVGQDIIIQPSSPSRIFMGVKTVEAK
ncbi:MAG: YCF48-related protein, partial [Patescibacteria group bacterium]